VRVKIWTCVLLQSSTSSSLEIQLKNIGCNYEGLLSSNVSTSTVLRVTLLVVVVVVHVCRLLLIPRRKAGTWRWWWSRPGAGGITRRHHIRCRENDQNSVQHSCSSLPSLRHKK
jgi:hypothetical protein